jgi:hyaluronan synthase
VAAVATHGAGRAGAYGLAVFLLLGAKLGASLRHRPIVASRPPALSVAVVVPFYNEDPAILVRAVRSIASQTYRPQHIIVIDDGSPNPAARNAVAALGIDGLSLVVQPTNRGKREALAVGFRMAPHVDTYLGVDSDTVLEPNALEEVLKPFADPEVTCVTGLVMASNHDRNLLTRLIDLRYANAFLYERAAYSRLGSVLCACGSLALYRASVVHRHLDDFLGQTFLGQPAVFGDDRRMTNYALLEGKAVLQQSAVAWTAVPERLGHFVRQQVRWNKSFWRESLWAIRHLGVGKPALWLSLLELTSWITFTIMLIAALIVAPATAGKTALIIYLGYLCLLAYGRSVRFFDVTRRETTRRRQLGTFALAPVYGILHLGLLLPLRFYSLLTLRSGSWGTRQQVEVSDAPRSGRRGRSRDHARTEVGAAARVAGLPPPHAMAPPVYAPPPPVYAPPPPVYAMPPPVYVPPPPVHAMAPPVYAPPPPVYAPPPPVHAMAPPVHVPPPPSGPVAAGRSPAAAVASYVQWPG